MAVAMVMALMVPKVLMAVGTVVVVVRQPMMARPLVMLILVLVVLVEVV